LRQTLETGIRGRFRRLHMTKCGRNVQRETLRTAREAISPVTTIHMVLQKTDQQGRPIGTTDAIVRGGRMT
jgi:hypothetical protein